VTALTARGPGRKACGLGPRTDERPVSLGRPTRDARTLGLRREVDLVQLVALEDTPLAIPRVAIERAFEPFVARHLPEGDAQWSRMSLRRKRRILRGFLRRRLFGWFGVARRDEELIRAEYEETWARGYERYALGRTDRVDPWCWRGERVLASPLGAPRFRHLLLSAAIELAKPASVLEIGCGDGINLLLLAGRFPEVSFTGIELTEQGPRAARALQRGGALPAGLHAYAPLPLADPAAFQRIRFLRANAAQLPFADSSFDLVTTVLALEQMERVRERALAELARVTRGSAFLIEPFRDVNRSGWRRRYVVSRDYFRGSLDELRRHGLEPQWATEDFPQESFLRVCASLARKGG